MDTPRTKYFSSLRDAEHYLLFVNFLYKDEPLQFKIGQSEVNTFAVGLTTCLQVRHLSDIQSILSSLSGIPKAEWTHIINQDDSIEPYTSLKEALWSIDPDILSFLIEMKLPFEEFVKLYIASKQ